MYVPVQPVVNPPKGSGEDDSTPPAKQIFTAVWANHSSHKRLRIDRSWVLTMDDDYDDPPDGSDKGIVRIICKNRPNDNLWITHRAEKSVLAESSLLFSRYFREHQHHCPFLFDNFSSTTMEQILQFMQTGHVRSEICHWQNFASALSHLQVGGVYPTEFEYQVEFNTDTGDAPVDDATAVYNRSPWVGMRNLCLPRPSPVPPARELPRQPEAESAAKEEGGNEANGPGPHGPLGEEGANKEVGHPGGEEPIPSTSSGYRGESTVPWNAGPGKIRKNTRKERRHNNSQRDGRGPAPF